MQVALKTGDEVSADSLEEAGTRPRSLKGTLEIIKVPASPPYPAFTAFFVGGQEANVATIRLDEPVLVAAFNPQQPRDENGRWAEQGSEQFKPGTTEGTIVALLEGSMKGGKYGQGAKTLDETMAFINDLREKGMKSGSTAEKEWVAAIDKVTPVWFKEKDAARKIEDAYRSAVENPQAPKQLFDPDYAKAVKARQTELAENQIISKQFVKEHPEYELEHGNEGSEYGWLNHSDTGEPLTQKELAYQARKWIAENETRAEEILARSDVYVRLEPPSLTRMLEDGRMRTFHEEQGQENSISNHEGGNTPEQRRRIEEEYFGKGTYPVYGYLADDPNGFLDLAHSHSLATVEAGLGFYGDIAVKLKPEVRARTTYTLGDSSALAGDHPVVVPQPLEHPTSLAGAHFADLHNSTTIREATLNNFGKVSYFESQIHGGVRLSDIDEVTFTYTPPPQIQENLKRLGVKWRALETDPEQGYSAEEYGLTAGALWRQRQAARIEQFYNHAHDEQGRFAETEVGAGAGFPADDATRDTRKVPDGWVQAGKTFQASLSGEERQAMQSWRGSPEASFDMRRIASGGELTYGDSDGNLDVAYNEKRTAEIQGEIDALKQALTRAPHTTPYLAYRGIRLGEEATQQEVDEHLAREFVPGDTISLSHPGNFQSASGKVGVAVDVSGDNTDSHEGVLFEIKARTMANISYDAPRATLNSWGYPAEHEVLFHPDTQFKVVQTLKRIPFRFNGATHYRTVIQVEEV